MAKRPTKPNFITIGAPHAGVGLMMKLLASHPEINNTIPTLNFFNTDSFTTKGLAWYQSQFNPASPLLCGECSPGYLSSKSSATKIAKHFPDTKLIVVLRHPIKRVIAHYEQLHSAPKTRKMSARDFMMKNPSAQRLGFYGQQLEKYFAYYSPIHVHIIIYEEFVADPLKVTANLFEFLGVNKKFIPTELKSYVPPPEEPRHKSLLYRLKKLVKKTYRRIIKPKKVNLLLPDYNLNQYFSQPDLTLLKNVYQKDALTLSRLLHKDMAVFWQLGE